jgi:hypothetical protein
MPIPPVVLAALAVLAPVLAIRAHYLDDPGAGRSTLFKPLATLLILALALSLPPARPEYNGRSPPACCCPPPAMSS